MAVLFRSIKPERKKNDMTFIDILLKMLTDPNWVTAFKWNPASALVLNSHHTYYLDIIKSLH